MEKIKRLIYLFYYLKETDFSQLNSIIKYASVKTGRSRTGIIFDMVCSVFRYNTSLKDYFSFRFFDLNASERKKWAGTGFMYQFQLQMNPKGKRELLEDKIMFLHHFKPCVKRAFCGLAEFIGDQEKAEEMLRNSSGLLVLKGSHGQIGAQVEVVRCSGYTATSLIDYMKTRKFDLIEEYIVQHPVLMELSPSGLNTVRIFTQLHNGAVEFLGARLRISVNSPVDNMAAGNLATAVDIKTGSVISPGVYSDITKLDQENHPVTGKRIVGFIVPFWKEVIDLAEKAALLTPENKSVGWDIAVTASGPELVEGNHNWCKLLWQLPVKKGLIDELEKYI
ncbi:MAG TPA: hexapeptide transferase [Bacteroidales bacterium]|nr:hexapeptide transferase [Bacteroidales bacterium]